MRAKVSKLARGIFDKITPEILISVSIIDGKIQTSKAIYNSFTITSQNDLEMRGLIYSSNPRVLCKEKSFIGKEASIHYEISAVGCEAGDKIKGEFLIICNGGEFTVPYELVVESAYIETSMGPIRNLFHFTNLLQKDYEEALKIFCSKDFESVFLLRNQEQIGIYEGLLKGNSKKVALEEFLIYVNKKSRVELEIKDTEIDYLDFQTSIGAKIDIYKNTWGYCEIEADTEGDFLFIQKKQVTSDDFAGNLFEFPYFIDESKVHAGLNYGKIYFRTFTQAYEVIITVYKNAGNEEEKEKRRAGKEEIYNLVNLYFEFRLHKMTTELWCRNSLKIVSKLEEVEEYADFVKLVKMQIMITQKRRVDVAEDLTEMAEKFLESPKKQVVLHSYYLYVKSLYVRDESFTKDALKQVKAYYEKGNKDWRILWVILYLEKEYHKNKTLKLAMIREQYDLGCRSPFLYYEACEIINEQAEIITDLNEFELQVLWWGCKADMLGEEVAMTILELAIQRKKFNPLLFKTLGYLYKKYKRNIILEAICGILIRNGMMSHKYFCWYELGVKQELKLTGLYENYINTMPKEYTQELPKILLLYFAYHNNLSDKKKAFIYHYVIRNGKENPTMLRNYIPSIELFAKEQLSLGRMNEDLAVIYKTIVSKSMIKGKVSEAYPELLLTQHFVCSNPAVKNVILKHKELNEEIKYPVLDGEAYFPIYTDNYILLLEDKNARRYLSHLDYSIDPLMREEGALRYCYENTGGDIYLWLHISEKGSIYGEDREAKVEIYKKILEDPKIKGYYKNIFNWSIIDYYLDNYDGEHLKDSLIDIENEELSSVERTRLIELYIVRSMYDEAYRAMTLYGYDEISPRHLTKFCSRMIQMKEAREDDFLLELCAYVFSKGKYDESILEYLINYYYSTISDMLTLWRASRNFSVDTIGLAERLIVQALFTQVDTSDLIEVFEEYYIRGSKEIVIYGYLTHQAYLYFAKESNVSEKIFFYLEKEGLNKGELNSICKLALLKFYSNLSSLTKEQVNLGENYLEELVQAGKLFGFYKHLESKWRLPFALTDKTILEYKTETGNKVTLHYLSPEQINDTMKYEILTLKESYEGIYTKEFILFYGEELEYYITENDSINLRENSKLEIGEWKGRTSDTRYGLLNDIIVAYKEDDSVTLEELVKQYKESTHMAEKWFACL